MKISSRFTISVVSNSIYNVDPKTFEGGESEILARAYEYMTPTRKAMIIWSLWKYYPFLKKILKMSLFRPGLHKFFIDLMTNSLKQREESGVNNFDYLEYLMELRNKKKITGEDRTSICKF